MIHKAFEACSLTDTVGRGVVGKALPISEDEVIFEIQLEDGQNRNYRLKRAEVLDIKSDLCLHIQNDVLFSHQWFRYKDRYLQSFRHFLSETLDACLVSIHSYSTEEWVEWVRLTSNLDRWSDKKIEDVLLSLQEQRLALKAKMLKDSYSEPPVVEVIRKEGD